MQEPEPIDWEYYRKGIGSRLVDMYKEAYDSMLTTFMASTLCFYFFLIFQLWYSFFTYFVRRVSLSMDSLFGTTSQPCSFKLLVCSIMC